MIEIHYFSRGGPRRFDLCSRLADCSIRGISIGDIRRKRNVSNVTRSVAYPRVASCGGASSQAYKFRLLALFMPAILGKRERDKSRRALSRSGPKNGVSRQASICQEGLRIPLNGNKRKARATPRGIPEPQCPLNVPSLSRDDGETPPLEPRRGPAAE